jgi:hypothetical protein
MTGEPKGDQPVSGASELTRSSRSKELVVKALLTAKLVPLKRVGVPCEALYRGGRLDSS